MPTVLPVSSSTREGINFAMNREWPWELGGHQGASAASLCFRGESVFLPPYASLVRPIDSITGFIRLVLDSIYLRIHDSPLRCGMMSGRDGLAGIATRLYFTGLAVAGNLVPDYVGDRVRKWKMRSPTRVLSKLIWFDHWLYPFR